MQGRKELVVSVVVFSTNVAAQKLVFVGCLVCCICFGRHFGERYNDNHLETLSLSALTLLSSPIFVRGGKRKRDGA